MFWKFLLSKPNVMLEKKSPNIWLWRYHGDWQRTKWVGEVIDPGLMSCHVLSLWNVLVSHVRLWGKSNKGKSQNNWDRTKEGQTFGPYWGLAWKQKLIGLFLAVDSLFGARVWLWSGILRFLIPTTVATLLSLQKGNSIQAVNLCLFVGF